MEWLDQNWLEIISLIVGLIGGVFVFNYYSHSTIKDNERIQTVANFKDALNISPLSRERDSEEAQIDFDRSDRLVIAMIDQIHAKNGKKEYSFENDLRDYLHLRNIKRGKTWYFSAAMHLAQSIQDLGPKIFFDSFQEIEDPRENNKFKYLRSEITFSYHDELQKMRHTDKDGTLKKKYISPHDLENGKTELPEEEMEKILDSFYQNMKKLLKFAIIN